MLNRSMKKDTCPKLVTLPQIGDSRLGYISVVEHEQFAPFAIRRVYWTYYTPQAVQRGGHAHKQLQQLIFAVSGQITIDVTDRNLQHHSFELTSPNVGIYVPPMCWRNLRFSHNAVLLCMASMEFSESDYIRTYEEFVKCLSQ
jgi:hypothetical protein